MKRLTVPVVILAVGVALMAGPAYAHGFGSATISRFPCGYTLQVLERRWLCPSRRSASSCGEPLDSTATHVSIYYDGALVER